MTAQPNGGVIDTITRHAIAGTVGTFLDLADDEPLPSFDDNDAWANATVTADDLAEILTSPDLARHRKGVRLAGLRIVGDLDLDEARLDRFLMLHRCQFGPHAIILTDAETRGIALHGSACGGLIADEASITGSVFLNEGFSATGEVRLPGARIGGQLNCRGATLTNPGGMAFVADRASIAGGVFLIDGFSASGEVRLPGTHIGGQLACRGATLANPGGLAFVADGASIARGVLLDKGFSATGVVSLVNARAGALVDSKADWPTELRINGFRYDALHSDAPGWRDRGQWLRRQVEPSPGPYRQLAAVYRDGGNDVDARKILMERHSALIRRDPPVRWRPHYPGRPKRAWRRFLGVTIGHGYEPWRALFFLLPVLVGMASWYTRADDHGLLTPNGQAKGVASSRCTSTYPCVQPLVYAADTLIPVVDFGQRSKWTPDVTARGPSRSPFDDGRWLAAATWVTSGLGWIFATLIIAGFSNVIRKE